MVNFSNQSINWLNIIFVSSTSAVLYCSKIHHSRPVLEELIHELTSIKSSYGESKSISKFFSVKPGNQ